ncbi:MAG: hypothetical protein ACKOJF_22700, partial [Planctomycetaceae bacterium]
MANEALDTQDPNGPGDADALNDLAAPFSGGDFRRFTERLRDVEELIDDPRLRAEAARIRERARALKAESQRHSTSPRWDLIRGEIARPLAELSQQVSEELLRRTSRESVVPLDRDPPPPGYEVVASMVIFRACWDHRVCMPSKTSLTTSGQSHIAVSVPMSL